MIKLFFWDTETSGLEPDLHQILTFAGVYTNPLLSRFSEFEKNIKIRKDVFPSEYALKVNKIDPYSEKFNQNAISELELLTLIESNESLHNGVVNYWLAYNQPFDLRMLKSTISKNNSQLNIQQNVFIDVMKLAKEVVLEKLIITPVKIDKRGKSYNSSTLEDVSIACGTPHIGDAHSALVDTHCMINTLKKLLFLKKMTMEDFLNNEKYRITY